MLATEPTPHTVWLSYALARGITARHRREALARYGHARALGAALHGLLHPPLLAPVDSPASFWPASLARALRAAAASDAFKAALDWQQAGPRRYLIGLDHQHYPASLLATSDPPPLLYLRGNLASLSGPQVAIVGSRQATGPALVQAQRLAAALAAAGIGVVSGLARGIDAAAHRGVLEEHGHTVAVQATAPNRVYPSAHRELAAAIEQTGLLLTEFPLGSVLRPGCFPRRNRLISGLALGVIVVEASVRSGSLITARHAADQGREVMAMPGSVANPQVRGCHELLRQGATLVESVDDVLQALQPSLCRWLAHPPASKPGDQPVVASPARQTQPLSDTRAPVHAAAPDVATEATPEVTPDAAILLDCLGFDALSVDALVHRSGLSVTRVMCALTWLELAAQVQTVAGARYQRSTNL